uniref:Ubiquitin-like domain-containing protein n=1 Tax=Ditylenchus dipsaci TaxID=166011 RepID=A0A915D1Z5_9BILA
MPPKQIDSDSDSGEDYYDDFSKYKKKHMIIKEAISSDLTVLESTSNDAESLKLAENSKTKGKKKQGDKKAKPSNEISELFDLDDELAELLDSPPTNIVSKPPVIAVRKCDRNLENILLATKSILNDAQFSEQPVLSDEVPATSADDSSTFEQRCTLVFRLNGQSFVVRCNMDDQFHRIIKENAAQLGMEASKVILMGKNCRIYPEKTPRNIGLDTENLNEIEVFEDCDAANDMLAIKWLMKGRKPIVSKILPQQTFKDLKERFCKEHELDPKKTRLVFDAETLAEDDTPEEMGLEEGDCIDVYLT